MRQAAIIPVVVLPRPIWSEKTQGVLAGSFLRASTIMSKLSSPADLSSVTGILQEKQILLCNLYFPSRKQEAYLCVTRLSNPFSFKLLNISNCPMSFSTLSIMSIVRVLTNVCHLGVLPHSLSVHRILSEGHVLHGPEDSLLLCRLGLQYLGVVSLKVLQLLHGEVDVQISVEILRVPGREGVAVYVDNRLLGEFILELDIKIRL